MTEQQERIDAVAALLDEAAAILAKAQTAAMHDDIDPNARVVLHDVLMGLRERLWDSWRYTVMVRNEMNADAPAPATASTKGA